MLTVEQVAKILHRSPTRVRKLLGEGRLVGEKLGRDWTVSEEALTEYRQRAASPLTTKQRDVILERDCYSCVDCGISPENRQNLHVHHDVPRDEGGTNDQSNLVTLCSGCHMTRHGRNPNGRDYARHDAAKKRVPLNRLVTEETFEAVKMLAGSLECSEGEVLDQAVMLLDSSVNGPQLSPAIPGLIKELSGLAPDAPAVKDAVALASSADSKYFHSNGQPMNYLERQAVDKREHLAIIAAADKTGAGRDDIEYDAQS